MANIFEVKMHYSRYKSEFFDCAAKFDTYDVEARTIIVLVPTERLSPDERKFHTMVNDLQRKISGKSRSIKHKEDYNNGILWALKHITPIHQECLLAEKPFDYDKAISLLRKKLTSETWVFNRGSARKKGILCVMSKLKDVYGRSLRDEKAAMEAEIAAKATTLEAGKKMLAVKISTLLGNADDSSRSTNLTYKGFHAEIKYSPEDGLFVGRVLNTEDLVAFEAATSAEVETSFHEMIDDYLAICNSIWKTENTQKGAVMS
jgi:Uncharacterized protein encoded in hypervariable junctions of pilus gene clusters